MRTDVHQHLWGPVFAEALRRRTAPPRLDGWTLHLPGRPPSPIDPAAHDVARRARVARDDGLDRVLISLSSPLGIESLPADEAAPLLDAYHADALALPEPFGAWAAAGQAEIDPAALARRLDQGFAGLQLPATALSDAAGYARCAPLLSLLEERDLPLFVHPGPVPAGVGTGVPALAGAPPAGAAPGGTVPADSVSGGPSAAGRPAEPAAGSWSADTPGRPYPSSAAAHPVPGSPGGRPGGRSVRPTPSGIYAGTPASGGSDPAGGRTSGGSGGPHPTLPIPEAPEWWDAVVPYVQQMHAAWFAFRAFGRPRHPRLRVCFALLAGLAPLHGERFAARGGGRGDVDRNAFAETSSYGPRGVDATARALGIDVVVLGSDRPYAGPAADFGLGDAAEHAIRVTNPERLLTGKE